MEFSGSEGLKFQMLDTAFLRVFRRRLLPASLRIWDLDDLWLTSYPTSLHLCLPLKLCALYYVFI